MGKYNLGEVSTTISDQIQRNRIYVNEKKAEPLVKDIDYQLDVLKKSFGRIHVLINQTVNLGVVSGKRADAFKAWAKKAKSQSNNSEKLRDNFVTKYYDDVRRYPLQLLDDRIYELEKKLEKLSNEM